MLHVVFHNVLSATFLCVNTAETGHLQKEKKQWLNWVYDVMWLFYRTSKGKFLCTARGFILKCNF